jgi:hypothetical protein
MANIYAERSEPLHEFLLKTKDDAGATVVIPELQRPYVWTPNQVSLLIDSLIRGWPFGTLLMWKVNHEELNGIPHRTFWRTIDRTKDGEEVDMMRRNPPAMYQMVLDGQQRLQSLILALGGDDSGFKLEDRQWGEELHSRRARGRQPKHVHWSKGSLCLDLDNFLEEYDRAGGLSGMDFATVLVWAITDSVGGQSTFPKPDNYIDPLRKCAYGSCLIRLSRLWNAAQPNQNLKEQHFREIAEEVLREHKIDQAKIEKLLLPIGEFMTTVRDLKLAKVTYLELLPFDKVLWTAEEYNDAIVSIFTRLNTAGRTLTREEITFAWLKSNWDPNLTESKSAVDCFQELLEDLKKRDLEIGMDDLVNAISFVWAARFNNGKLLANSDLLKGAVIRPMAISLATVWSTISDSVLTVTEVVQSRSFSFGPGGQYGSINALSVLWSWLTLVGLWRRSNGLPTLRGDEFDKKCDSSLNEFIDRWLLCSTWAGKWAESSNTAMAAFAKDLHEAWLLLENTSDPSDAHEILHSFLKSVTKNLETDAINYINTVGAPSRERVSIYRNFLWLWHRLETERWNYSSIPLRIGKKKLALEVDHTLSHGYWEKRLANEEDSELFIEFSNKMGNCALLEKSFNISKSDRSLRDFLKDVHEFKEGKMDIDSWSNALLISKELLDPPSYDLIEIADSVDRRDQAIRSELCEFVLGLKNRTDL